MVEVLTLAAQQRARVGKGASRALRRQGMIPAVIYGDRKPPLSVNIEEKHLVKMLATGFFLNSAVEVQLDGKKIHTLPRDVQFHPVTDRPLHVDFLRIAADAIVTVNLPVRFENEDDSPGLKRGGVLNVVRHEFEVQVPANAIPDYIVVDVTGYEVGESIHISKVVMPEGVTPVIDRDFTIATIAAPSGLKSQEAAEGGEAGEAESEEESEGEAEE